MVVGLIAEFRHTPTQTDAERGDLKATVLRMGAVVFLTAYVAATGWFLARNMSGDPGTSPPAYFFTWDMFPSYVSESTRKLAVARTEGGVYRQLVPGPRDQFRWGQTDRATRFDLDRGGHFWQEAAERALERSAGRHRDDPIVYVYLIEEYWPVRFNLSEELYESEYGEPKPARRYWRVVDQFAVDGAERLPTSDSPLMAAGGPP